MGNQSFGSFFQFLQMGGFGDYVWSAYGITFFVLAWLIFSTWRKRKKISKR